MELKDLKSGMKISKMYQSSIVLESGETIEVDTVIKPITDGYKVDLPEIEVIILRDSVYSVVEKGNVLPFEDLSVGMTLLYPCVFSKYIIQNTINEQIAFQRPMDAYLLEPEAYKVILFSNGIQLICSYEGNWNIQIKNKVGNSEEERIFQFFSNCFYNLTQNRSIYLGELLSMLIYRSEPIERVDDINISIEFLQALFLEFIENVKSGKKIESKYISKLWYALYK